MDEKIAALLPDLNRRALPRATRNAVLRLSDRAWASLLEVLVDEHRLELQKINAISLLVELQIVGKPAAVNARDRGELFRRLIALALSNKRRIRVSAVAALIRMYEQSIHGSSWPAVSSDMREQVEGAVRKALEVGLDKNSREYAEWWLAKKHQSAGGSARDERG